MGKSSHGKNLSNKLSKGNIGNEQSWLLVRQKDGSFWESRHVSQFFISIIQQALIRYRLQIRCYNYPYKMKVCMRFKKIIITCFVKKREKTKM